MKKETKTKRKPIKAVFIDVIKKEVRDIVLQEGGAYRPELFDLMTLPGVRPVDDINVVRIDNEVHYLHVDGEGLFKDPKAWFWLKGYGNPMAGHGVVIRVDHEGESVDATLTAKQVAPYITFDTLQHHGFVNHVAQGMVYGKPGTIITKRAVITKPGEGVDNALALIADELGIPVDQIKWTRVETEEADPSEQPQEGEGGENNG